MEVVLAGQTFEGKCPSTRRESLVTAKK